MGPKVENPGRGAATELLRYYKGLLRHLGPQNWWPARARLEVVLGAILTQNTNWRNAAMALKSLRKAGLLSLPRLRQATRTDLERHVRRTGFFRQKARTIRSFLDYLERARQGSLGAMFAQPDQALRKALLEIPGLGPETVDAILLYAGRKPFFVADAYTRRILARHALVPEGTDYSRVQEFLHRRLPRDQALFNEFHALLVETGKRYCALHQPRCLECPLRPFLPRPTAPATGSTGSRAGIQWAFLSRSEGAVRRPAARVV